MNINTKNGILGLLLLASLGQAESLYRCQDGGGVKFQDSPCSGYKSGTQPLAPLPDARPSYPGFSSSSSRYSSDELAARRRWERATLAEPPSQSVGAVKSNGALLPLLPLLGVTPPRQLAEHAEFILVSGYEAAKGPLNVLVNRPGKNVVLVLTSYETVAWQVEATSSTQIKGILVAAYKPAQVGSRFNIKAYAVQLPYAYETQGKNFADILNQLDRWFGVRKVDVFRGQYSLVSPVQITERDVAKPEFALASNAAQPMARPSQFDLYTQGHRFEHWSVNGPVGAGTGPYLADGKSVVSPDGNQLYSIENNQLNIRNVRTGKVERVPLPAHLPAFSWVMGMAYDSRRDIVAVVSLGGEGYLYQFDVRNGLWLGAYSMNNVDVFALAYDSSRDRYLAFNGANLLVLSRQGTVEETLKLTEKLPGFLQQYDRNRFMHSAEPLGFYPSGSDVAVVVFSGGQVQRIWRYDTRSQSAQLTYQNDGSHRAETRLVPSPVTGQAPQALLAQRTEVSVKAGSSSSSVAVNLCVNNKDFEFASGRCRSGWQSSPGKKVSMPAPGSAQMAMPAVPPSGKSQDVVIPDTVRQAAAQWPRLLTGDYGMRSQLLQNGEFVTYEGHACLPGDSAVALLQQLRNGHMSIPGECSISNWQAQKGLVSYRYSCTQNGKTAASQVMLRISKAEIAQTEQVILSAPSSFISGNRQLQLRWQGDCH